MSPTSLIKLISSLSGPEKRYFKLQSRMQGGDKEYLLLFDLIDKQRIPDVAQLKQQFREKSPSGSWENTCMYLSKLLIDCLVRMKTEKDVFFHLMHELLEIRVLNERSLEQEAYKQVKKVQEKAAQHQLHWIEYYCYRYELSYHADNNYPGITDEQLIRLQMKGKDVLKSLNHIQDHYSLYEVLKYRLVHAGKVVSEEDKKAMNDLMLSEMVLVAGKSRSFTSQKLHLLFQSFFFTNIGDYQSALKSFYQLNALMEKNEKFLDHPPLDYLSALNGIIDSLRTLHNTSDITYYLDKVKNLDQPAYPEYFRCLVRKTTYAYQIYVLLQTGEGQQARMLVESIPPEVLENYGMVDEEKQGELYFYCSLAYFLSGQWQKAHLLIRDIMSHHKLPCQSLVGKAIRLLNIIIYHEKGELLHLEYEIRSYKRFYGQTRLLKTEKMLFKFIGILLSNKRFFMIGREQKKMVDEVDKLAQDRYEQQLAKYFDFPAWVLRTMERRTPRPAGNRGALNADKPKA